MIYRLKGAIIEKEPGYAAIDVGGVAYEVSVSLATYAALPPLGETAAIYTHMVLRDDGVSLYGFSSLEEKKIFLSLITVSGIGPKVAIKILGGVGPERLKTAIASSDYELLAAVPGVGKKTAERIVLELKDKFEGVSLSSHIPGDVREDVVGALVNLGYKLSDSRKAVEGTEGGDDFEKVLKSALQSLSGKM